MKPKRDPRFAQWYPPDGPLVEPYRPWRRPLGTDPYFARQIERERGEDERRCPHCGEVIR